MNKLRSYQAKEENNRYSNTDSEKGQKSNQKYGSRLALENMYGKKEVRTA